MCFSLWKLKLDINIDPAVNQKAQIWGSKNVQIPRSVNVTRLRDGPVFSQGPGPVLPAGRCVTWLLGGPL